MSTFRLASLGRALRNKPTHSSIKIASKSIKFPSSTSSFASHSSKFTSTNLIAKPVNVLTFNHSFHSSRIFKQDPKEVENGGEKPSEAKEGGEKQQDGKVGDLQIQIEELRNKLLYSLAERENARTRAAKEVDNAKKFGITSFAKDLLSVADNLSRCLAAVDLSKLESNPDLKELHTGISLTGAELEKVFKNHQLEKFNPAGQKFDPNSMNAIAYFPDPSKEGGSVAEVLKSGYYLNGRVLRAADVAVVKPESVSK